MEGAPNLDTAEGKRAAPDWIDRFISCLVPEAGQDEELRDLVLRLQQPAHTYTCRRPGPTDCRFDYPIPSSNATRLKTEADKGHRSRAYILRRSEAECMTNAYNPYILKAWGANMDIQVVCQLFAA